VSTAPKFALVGAGVIGKHHGLVMSQLADRLSLVAVADIDLPAAEALAAERGGRPYASLNAALVAEEIDVVVVCTPTGRHGEVAIEALEAGKHVIVEKPLALTVDQADDLILMTDNIARQAAASKAEEVGRQRSMSAARQVVRVVQCRIALVRARARLAGILLQTKPEA